MGWMECSSLVILSKAASTGTTSQTSLVATRRVTLIHRHQRFGPGRGIPIMRANWVKSVSGGRPALKKRSPCTCTKVSQARKMDWRRCGTSLGTQAPVDQLARTRLEISMASTRGLAPPQLSSETEGRLQTTRSVSYWCRDHHLGRMPRLLVSLGVPPRINCRCIRESAWVCRSAMVEFTYLRFARAGARHVAARPVP